MISEKTIFHLLLCLLLSSVLSQDTTFYCLPDSDLNKITDRNGTIKTLYQGDSNYRDNQECSWSIDVGGNSLTKVQFTVTSNGLEWVPEGSICIGYDYVQIINGNSEYDPVQLTWCGKYNPHIFVSMGPKVFIKFSSNDRNVKSGVTLEYNTFTIGEGSCPQGWLKHDDHCYIIGEDKVTWVGAYENCKHMGANLVSFQNDDEADFIKGVISNRAEPRMVDYYWLGLTDIESEGQYEWVDRIESVLDFRWIADDHKPDKYYDCVVMRSSDGKWEEQFCTEGDVRTLTKNMYICKRNQSEETHVFPPPEEQTDTEGEGTIAIGKKYIIAAIIVSVIILILVVAAFVGFKRFGDDIKQKIRRKGRNRRDVDSDSEAVSLPPYTRRNPRQPPTAPAENFTIAQQHPSPPPPYSALADTPNML